MSLISLNAYATSIPQLFCSTDSAIHHYSVALHAFLRDFSYSRRTRVVWAQDFEILGSSPALSTKHELFLGKP